MLAAVAQPSSAALPGPVLASGPPLRWGDVVLKFLLTPIGSAGDVFPFVGLALRLRERGHEVAMISNGHFGPLIRSHGISFEEFGSADDYRKAIEHPEIFHPIRGFQTVINFVRDQRKLLDLIRPHARQGAIVIHHTLCFAARLLEEAHQARVISIILQPATIRSVYDGPVMGGNHGITLLPRFLQRAIWHGVDTFLVDPAVSATIDDLRAELHLPRQRHCFANWIHSPNLSIALFPDWYAPPQPDWPASLRQASFPLCDSVSGQSTPPALQQLLDSGTRPIVFTPGTGNIYAHQFFAAATAACCSLNRPAILLTTHRDHLPATLPPNIHHFDFAPLSQILPRCAALVHHGGIGTTAAALAAGIPQIIMPLSHDQPDNAARIVRHHWGLRLWPRRFTAKRLATSLDQLLSAPAIATATQSTATRLAQANGLTQACDLMESQGS